MYVAHQLHPSLPPNSQIIVGTDAFQEFINEIYAQQLLAIDTETTGLVRWKDLPLYWSLAWGRKRATLNADTLQYFTPLLQSPIPTWIFAYAKYDMHILANVGITIAGECIDTCVEHALLYEDRPHKLKFMANHILKWTWADFQDTFGKIGKKQSAEDVIRRAERENMGLLVEYAANDAWGTLHLHYELKKQLEKAKTYSLFHNRYPYIQTLWDFFNKIEKPYTKTLWRMERKGAKIDRARLEKAEPIAREEIQGIEKELFKLRGKAINPNSPKQVQQFLFEDLGLKPIKMTKGGKSGNRSPSADKDVLEHYKHEHPGVGLILRHHELSKLHGTYLTGLTGIVDPHDRIHSSFNQDVARTGRLSSSDPNLQNIPRIENDKWNLRSAFIPEDGYTIIAVDYQQLEMRLLACASMEPRMIDIFHQGRDIHTGNVEMVFGLPYDDVVAARAVDKAVKSGQMDASSINEYVRTLLQKRYDIKEVGFGLNYGMGANLLARKIGVSRAEAQALIDKYMGTYPAVRAFFDDAIAETERTGYAFTVMGRRRNIPEIASTRRDERARGERLASNTQIQGSAADVTRSAQINIDKLQITERYDCHQILQVHDEIVFECRTECVPDAIEEITELMQHPFPMDLAVQTTVDAGFGDSWGTSH